jgi:hypothetical protein
MRLNRISCDNQLVAKGYFEPQSKESIGLTQAAVKSRMNFRQFPRVALGNFT